MLEVTDGERWGGEKESHETGAEGSEGRRAVAESGGETERRVKYKEGEG